MIPIMSAVCLLGEFVLLKKQLYIRHGHSAAGIAAGSYDVGFVIRLAVTKVAAGVVFGVVLLLFSGSAANSRTQEQRIINECGNVRAADMVTKTVVSVFFITLHVFAVIFILDMMIELVGMDVIRQKAAGLGVFQVVAMAFIGYGALISGLCANTGHGVIVIFRSLPQKKALSFTALLLAIRVFTGSIIMFLQNKGVVL